MNGAALPTEYAENEFLLRVQRLARFMRWVACAVVPDVYEVCREDAARNFPEASTLFFMWSAVEDRLHQYVRKQELFLFVCVSCTIRRV